MLSVEFIQLASSEYTSSAMFIPILPKKGIPIPATHAPNIALFCFAVDVDFFVYLFRYFHVFYYVKMKNLL